MIAKALLLAVTLHTAATDPYPPAASSTVAGATRTAERLLETARTGDDAAFDTLARGMVAMLAPDFGAPVTRAQFAEMLRGCTDHRIASAEPFPGVPAVRAVRVVMRCPVDPAAPPREVVMELMADDQHVMAAFPGGVANIWPTAK